MDDCEAFKGNIRTAVVVEPSASADVVRFGATVSVRDPAGETDYRIVAVDEADFDRGWISWCSPLARALVNRRVGERVRFCTPEGERELEIVRIAFRQATGNGG